MVFISNNVLDLRCAARSQQAKLVEYAGKVKLSVESLQSTKLDGD